jgi:hypothetical protein
MTFFCIVQDPMDSVSADDSMSLQGLLPIQQEQAQLHETAKLQCPHKPIQYLSYISLFFYSTSLLFCLSLSDSGLQKKQGHVDHCFPPNLHFHIADTEFPITYQWSDFRIVIVLCGYYF